MSLFARVGVSNTVWDRENTCVDTMTGLDMYNFKIFSLCQENEKFDTRGDMTKVKRFLVYVTL